MSEITIHCNNKKTPSILRTKDYSMFKLMKGNRKVTPKRVKDIRSSIENIGLVPVPIVVNEYMEIIDGQGRYKVLEQMQLPVFYMVVPGLGVDDCISMNINTTPWGIMDYITSYADRGNKNYQRLIELIESYDLPMTVAICAATGVMATSNSSIKEGKLDIDEEYFFAIGKMLSWVERFAKVMKENDISNRSAVYSALCFCYQCEDVDNNRMYNQFVRYCHKLTSATKIVEVLDTLTEIYNFGRKVGKVYITTKYLEYLDGKYSWYSSYWGSRHESKFDEYRLEESER